MVAVLLIAAVFLAGFLPPHVKGMRLAHELRDARHEFDYDQRRYADLLHPYFQRANGDFFGFIVGCGVYKAWAKVPKNYPVPCHSNALNVVRPFSQAFLRALRIDCAGKGRHDDEFERR